MPQNIQAVEYENFFKPALIINNAPTKKSESEQAIEEDGISYIETREPELLNQYFEIREKAYREKLGLRGFEGGVDRFDGTSDIILAVANNKIVGGLRVTIHDEIINKTLPLEEEKFRLKELLPELTLENKIYAECSRMALKEGFSNGKCSAVLYGALIRKCQRLGIKYVFGIAPLPHIRNYKIIYKKYFNLNIVMRNDIQVPSKIVYSGIKSDIFLSYLVL